MRKVSNLDMVKMGKYQGMQSRLVVWGAGTGSCNLLITLYFCAFQYVCSCFMTAILKAIAYFFLLIT